MKDRLYRGTPPAGQAKGPAIVLVRPQLGENIGMCARAMLNCGLTDLRLVAPRDGWPNEKAQSASSGAMAVIDNARIYGTLVEAVGDCTFVIATTARERDLVKPVVTPASAAAQILHADRHGPTSAFIFGPERAGLENDDLICCDVLLNIPLNPEYSSLNIAQAVLLASYEWYQQALKQPADKPAILDEALVTKTQMDYLLSHLETALDEAGFFTATNLKPTVLRNLKNSFQRMRLSTQEAHTFHGVIKALRGKK